MTHDDTNTSSLTLEALLAAHAARTPAEKERDLAYAIAADLGLHAQQLADHHLASGDLTNARRWYQVAAHYDIPGAADALNDVETLIEVTATIETSTASEDRHGARGTDTADTEDTADNADSDVTQITVLDDLAAAAALIRRAHEHVADVENRARDILDNARDEADRIVTSARHDAERAAGIAAERTVSQLTDLLAGQGRADEALTLLQAINEIGDWNAAHRLAELLAEKSRVADLAGEGDTHTVPSLANFLGANGAVFLHGLAATDRSEFFTRFAERLTKQDFKGHVPGMADLAQERLKDTAFRHHSLEWYQAVSHESASTNEAACRIHGVAGIQFAHRWAERLANRNQDDNATLELCTARNRLLDFLGDASCLVIVDGLTEVMRLQVSDRPTLWTPGSAATRLRDVNWARSPRETIRVSRITGSALQDLGTAVQTSPEDNVPQTA